MLGSKCFRVACWLGGDQLEMTAKTVQCMLVLQHSPTLQFLTVFSSLLKQAVTNLTKTFITLTLKQELCFTTVIISYSLCGYMILWSESLVD